MLPRRIPPSGLFLALLALVAQLAFGAIVPRPEIALVFEHAGPICHAPTPPGVPATPTHRPAPDWHFCPLCTALATPAPVPLDAGPHVPPPPIAAFHRPGLPPPATAPPAIALLAAQPRGPPSLV